MSAVMFKPTTDEEALKSLRAHEKMIQVGRTGDSIRFSVNKSTNDVVSRMGELDYLAASVQSLASAHGIPEGAVEFTRDPESNFITLTGKPIEPINGYDNSVGAVANAMASAGVTFPGSSDFLARGKP